MLVSFPLIPWLVLSVFSPSHSDRCFFFSLLQEVSSDTTGTLTAAEERKEKVPSPHLSHLVVLTSGSTLYGLAERVVATESLCVQGNKPHLFCFVPLLASRSSGSANKFMIALC